MNERRMPDGGVRIVAGDMLILERPEGTVMPAGWTLSTEEPGVWRCIATVADVSYEPDLIVVSTL